VAAARAARGLLFGVSPFDPVSLCAAAALPRCRRRGGVLGARAARGAGGSGAVAAGGVSDGGRAMLVGGGGAG
jgi:hypothetical protein